MAIQFLPCGGDPDITYRITLEGVDYDFRYRYLQRITNVATRFPIKADEWNLEVSLTGGDIIFDTALKTNREILKPYYYREGCPQGSLIVRDIVADASLGNRGDYSPERITYDDFGKDKRFRVVYVTSDSYTR